MPRATASNRMVVRDDEDCLLFGAAVLEALLVILGQQLFEQNIKAEATEILSKLVCGIRGLTSFGLPQLED